MARFWIRVGTKRYCLRGLHSTCFRSQLYSAADDPNADPHILAATTEINEILSRLEHDHAGPDRTLAFVTLPDGDDDILGLDWIYHDEEITTSCDQNYTT